MANLPGQGFNPGENFDDELLATGTSHVFEIVDSSYEQSKHKAGSAYIKITFDGVKGMSSEGHRVWQNFTWENDNATAVRMGKRAFKALCEACGIMSVVTNTQVLHGRRVLCEVELEKGSGGFADKNQMVDYKPINGAAATGAPAIPQAPYQPPAAPQQYQAPQAPPQAAPPVYQAPVQPQAPPVEYAAPAQPQAAPVYQPPAQPAAPQAPVQAPQVTQPPAAPAYQPQAPAAPTGRPQWEQ